MQCMLQFASTGVKSSSFISGMLGIQCDTKVNLLYFTGFQNVFLLHTVCREKLVISLEIPS